MSKVHKAYLSIGSNIDKEQNIRSCLSHLHNAFGELALSSVYESEAVGFEGSNFYNLVAAIETDISLTELSRSLKAMEDAHDRDRSGPKFSGRTLDIDIICFDSLVGIHEGIELPRPELYFNAFVLLPMAELVPEKHDPKTGKSYEALWQEMGTDQKLWKVEL